MHRGCRCRAKAARHWPLFHIRPWLSWVHVAIGLVGALGDTGLVEPCAGLGAIAQAEEARRLSDDYHNTTRVLESEGAGISSGRGSYDDSFYTALACEGFCDAAGDCNSFTYNPATGHCYLKVQCVTGNEPLVTPLHQRAHLVTYFKPCPTSTTVTTTDPTAIYSALGRRAVNEGEQLANYGDLGETLDQCARRCTEHNRCNSFTFKSAPAPSCHLKAKCILPNEPIAAPDGRRTYYRPCTTTGTTATLTMTTTTLVTSFSAAGTTEGGQGLLRITSSSSSPFGSPSSTSAVYLDIDLDYEPPTDPLATEVSSSLMLRFTDAALIRTGDGLDRFKKVVRIQLGAAMNARPGRIRIDDSDVVFMQRRLEEQQRHLQDGLTRAAVSFSLWMGSVDEVVRARSRWQALQQDAAAQTVLGQSLASELARLGFSTVGTVTVQSLSAMSRRCPCAPGWGRPFECVGECQRCSLNQVGGVNGICTPCGDGQEPDGTGSTCQRCAADSAGNRGICERCPEGMQPDEDAITCEDELAWGLTEEQWVALGSAFAGLTLLVGLLTWCLSRHRAYLSAVMGRPQRSDSGQIVRLEDGRSAVVLDIPEYDSRGSIRTGESSERSRASSRGRRSWPFRSSRSSGTPALADETSTMHSGVGTETAETGPSEAGSTALAEAGASSVPPQPPQTPDSAAEPGHVHC